MRRIIKNLGLATLFTLVVSCFVYLAYIKMSGNNEVFYYSGSISLCYLLEIIIVVCILTMCFIVRKTLNFTFFFKKEKEERINGQYRLSKKYEDKKKNTRIIGLIIWSFVFVSSMLIGNYLFLQGNMNGFVCLGVGLTSLFVLFKKYL